MGCLLASNLTLYQPSLSPTVAQIITSAILSAGISPGKCASETLKKELLSGLSLYLIKVGITAFSGLR